MAEHQRILLAVDATEESLRAQHYVGRMATRLRGGSVCLIHVMPCVPPALREHPGAERPQEEERLGLELKARTKRWLTEQHEAALPVLDKARAVLRKAGLPREQLESHVLSRDDHESVADTCVRAAREMQCDTVVVGRTVLSRMAEVLHEHTCDTLIEKGRGLTIWVVE